MAFPVIQDRTTTSVATDGTTTHTISYPSTVNAGDLLVCVAGFDGVPGGITWPSGWNELIDLDSNVGLGVAWREAVGDEDGSTFDVTVTTGQSGAHIIYRITGAEDPDTQAPEVTSFQDSGFTHNPPANTPTGGSKEYLWIAVSCMNNAEGASFTIFPSGYGNTGTVDTVGTGSGNVAIAYCDRTNEAASEDPGTFTTDISVNGQNITIAIHPGADTSIVKDVDTHVLITRTRVLTN